MTPPLDDDSLQESIDISLPSEEPVHPVFKEYRELRSSTRALAVSISHYFHIRERLQRSIYLVASSIIPKEFIFRLIFFI